ncbi:hypothetical protein A0H81_13560 [Grifola frondosa]|uniref:Uncharacterized protein n=1 Tax=Grifola frondosa TaxID=5627 RepID=A0A1C7LQT5_GRIFR|nr:hypothetical protein A0H81_13560 [Grifola frondosa]
MPHVVQLSKNGILDRIDESQDMVERRALLSDIDRGKVSQKRDPLDVSERSPIGFCGWGKVNIDWKNGEASDSTSLCTRNSTPSEETNLTSASGKVKGWSLVSGFHTTDGFDSNAIMLENIG